MLVISRKIKEAIKIGDEIIIKILEINKNQVKLGIEAPKNVTILRAELIDEVKKENIKANKNLSIEEIKKLKKVLNEN